MYVSVLGSFLCVNVCLYCFFFCCFFSLWQQLQVNSLFRYILICSDTDYIHMHKLFWTMPLIYKKTFIETLMSSFIRLMTVNIITNTNTNTNTYIPTYIQSCILQLTSTAWTCSESFIMMIRDVISDYKCTPVRNMPTAVNSCMSSFSRD